MSQPIQPIFVASVSTPNIVDGDLLVTGDETVDGNLTVRGVSTTSGTFNPANVSTNGTLFVGGTSTFTGDVTMNHNLTVLDTIAIPNVAMGTGSLTGLGVNTLGQIVLDTGSGGGGGTVTTVSGADSTIVVNGTAGGSASLTAALNVNPALSLTSVTTTGTIQAAEFIGSGGASSSYTDTNFNITVPGAAGASSWQVNSTATGRNLRVVNTGRVDTIHNELDDGAGNTSITGNLTVTGTISGSGLATMKSVSGANSTIVVNGTAGGSTTTAASLSVNPNLDLTQIQVTDVGVHNVAEFIGLGNGNASNQVVITDSTASGSPVSLLLGAATTSTYGGVIQSQNGPLHINPTGGAVSTQNNILDNGSGTVVISSTQGNGQVSINANSGAGAVESSVQFLSANNVRSSIGWSGVAGCFVYDNVNGNYWLKQDGTTSKRVSTFNNVLDDGAGNMSVAGNLTVTGTITGGGGGSSGAFCQASGSGTGGGSFYSVAIVTQSSGAGFTITPVTGINYLTFPYSSTNPNLNYWEVTFTSAGTVGGLSQATMTIGQNAGASTATVDQGGLGSIWIVSNGNASASLMQNNVVLNITINGAGTVLGQSVGGFSNASNTWLRVTARQILL